MTEPRTPMGEIVLSEWTDPQTRDRHMRIDRADPRALIALELMVRIAADECLPFAEIKDGPPQTLALSDSEGRSYIYRIVKFNDAERAYEVEWPD